MASGREFGHLTLRPRTKVIIAPTWTGNRRWICPQQAYEHELSSECRPHGTLCVHEKWRQKVLGHWTLRSANQEADRLANGGYAGFDPARRLQVTPDGTRSGGGGADGEGPGYHPQQDTQTGNEGQRKG